MKKICEHCGVEFEGASQARFHSDACRKASTRSKVDDPDLPVRQVRTDKLVGPDADVPPEPELPPDTRPVEKLLVLGPTEPLSEAEEQLLRDHFGYSDSEKRTRAERQAAADGIVEKTADLKDHPNVLAAFRTLREQEARSAAKRKAYLDSLKDHKVPSP